MRDRITTNLLIFSLDNKKTIMNYICVFPNPQ